MEPENGDEIEKLNAQIDDLRLQLKTVSGDVKEEIEGEISSLEVKRDQMMTSLKQGAEEMEEDLEDIV